METLLTEQWHKRSLPGSRHDEYINTISNFTPLAFAEEYGSAGLISRIIELARLREMKPLLDTFEVNTGYRVGNSDCTEQELDVLTLRVVELHKDIHAQLKEQKISLSQCDEELTRIKSGGGGSNGHIVRDKAFAANENKERLTRSIAKTESWCEFVSSIICVLNNELKSWEQDGYKRKVNLPQVTAHSTSMYYLKSISREARVILTKLDTFESAIESINSRFIMPTDRYERRRPTALLNIEACKFYYSREGEITRHALSCADYINSVISPMENAIQRHNDMKSDIDYNQQR